MPAISASDELASTGSQPVSTSASTIGRTAPIENLTTGLNTVRPRRRWSSWQNGRRKSALSSKSDEDRLVFPRRPHDRHIEVSILDEIPQVNERCGISHHSISSVVNRDIAAGKVAQIGMTGPHARGAYLSGHTPTFDNAPRPNLIPACRRCRIGFEESQHGLYAVVAFGGIGRSSLMRMELTWVSMILAETTSDSAGRRAIFRRATVASMTGLPPTTSRAASTNSQPTPAPAQSSATAPLASTCWDSTRTARSEWADRTPIAARSLRRCWWVACPLFACPRSLLGGTRRVWSRPDDLTHRRVQFNDPAAAILVAQGGLV